MQSFFDGIYRIIICFGKKDQNTERLHPSLSCQEKRPYSLPWMLSGGNPCCCHILLAILTAV